MTDETIPVAQTAQEAYERYACFHSRDALVQSNWHETAADGRQLACALGVLGPDVDSTTDCPSSVMPRWLAQMTVGFFDGQNFDDAKDWGLRFYAELKRLNGLVPFSVVHDWQANVVGPLAIEVAEKRNRKPELHRVLAEMQAKAFAGEKFTADEWHPVLKAAFFDADADANAYANAYANNANANAYANNANAYAYANANANAYAYANAYANAYADAYANAYAYANNANAYAYAYADANADAYAYANARKANWKRLADGMVDCLARVPTP